MKTVRGFRLLAATAMIGTVVTVGGATAHATTTSRAVASHPSFALKANLAHVITKGMLYRHVYSKLTDHDQNGGCKKCLVTGPLHSRKQNPSSRLVGNLPGAPVGGVHPRVFTLQTNTAHAVASCQPAGCWPLDTSEASDGNVVVYTANETISFSTNFGATFTSFPSGSFFSDLPAGGPCCDQVMQYVPSINRFIWLDQYWAGPTGKNLYRLVAFAPSAVSAGGLSSFTYWDIYSPSGTYPFMDFPDLAVGNRYLYLTCDLGGGGHVFQTAMFRIGLTNLQLSLNLASAPTPWRYIIGTLFFGRTAQNTGAVAYWAAPKNTSQMNIGWWPEAGNNYFGPATVNIASWPGANFTSTNPDANSWNSTYTGVVLADAVTHFGGGSQLWLAWPAGVGTGSLSWLTRPHVELVEINVASMSFMGQTAIWNPSFAISFPALAVARNGDLGINFAYGGSGHWTNTAITDWTQAPFVAWQVTNSTASDGHNRWGDYAAIRPEYGMAQTGAPMPAGGFTASCYGVLAAVTGQLSRSYDTHWVAFNL